MSAPWAACAPALLRSEPAIAILLRLFRAPVQSRHRSWLPVLLSAPLFGGLYGHGMASVQGTATVYMFGGESGNSGTRTNDLWCFFVDNKPLDWVRLETNLQGIAWETRPRATQYHSMSAVGDDIYIFGGEMDRIPPGASEYSNEMWKFSTRGPRCLSQEVESPSPEMK